MRKIGGVRQLTLPPLPLCERGPKRRFEVVLCKKSSLLARISSNGTILYKKFSSAYRGGAGEAILYNKSAPVYGGSGGGAAEGGYDLS